MRNRVPHQIERAIKVAGSAAELARLINVDADFVRQWRNGTKQVPGRYCNRIESATSGRVSRAQLRPDDYWELWPELIGTKGAPKVKLAKAA